MADMSDSPEQDPLLIPRPVAEVTQRLNELLDSYARVRSSEPPAAALQKALGEVLSGNDRSDVLSFLDGSQDEIYGPGSGAKFERMLIDDCERYHDGLNSIWSKAAARQQMSPEELADHLASDQDLFGRFSGTLQRRTDESRDEVVSEAVALLLEAVSRLPTASERRKASRKVARRLSTARRKAPPEQSLWCAFVCQQFIQLVSTGRRPPGES
jgi:hypothetical protein